MATLKSTTNSRRKKGYRESYGKYLGEIISRIDNEILSEKIYQELLHVENSK